MLWSKSQLAILPTSACAFYIITLLICDEVIRFGFLGLFIHFANPLCVFEVTTQACWISLTAYIASRQFPGLCSSIGVTAECFAMNWDLINFALLTSRLTRTNQGQEVKCKNCHRHLVCSRPNLKKNKKSKIKQKQNKAKKYEKLNYSFTFLRWLP